MAAGFLVIVAQWSEHWLLQCSIVTCKCLAPVLGLTLQEKASRSFFCLWGPSPEDNDITHKPSPPFLIIVSGQTLEGGKALETRLNLTKNRDYSLPDQQQCPFCCIAFVPSWCKVGVGS